MKKTTIAVALLIGSFSLKAQDAGAETAQTGGGDDTPLTKKGYVILPEAGDIALGFNTVPMIDFALNTMRYVSIFGNSAPAAGNVAANAIQYTANSNNQIVGKYYLDAKTAVRVRVGINTLAGTVRNEVQDAAAMGAALNGTVDDQTAAALLKVEDEMSFSKTNVLIGAGYEMRRGYGRLQGFYGGEVSISRQKAREDVTYGNEFSDQYAVQYTNNFNSLGVTTHDPDATNGNYTRNLSDNYSGTFGFGLRAFVGIEYFIARKISIATEFGWGYGLTTQGTREITNERYFQGENGPVVAIEETEVSNSGTTNALSVDNDGQNNALNNTFNGNTTLSGGSASITILFHF